MTPERKKKLRVILAVLLIHSCDWWLRWEYEVCKAKKSRFVPSALAAKEGSWRTEERAGAQSSWEEEGKKAPLWLYCLTVFNCGRMCFYQWLNVFFGQVIDERCGQPKDLESASEGEYSADQAVTSCDTPSRPSQHQPPSPQKTHPTHPISRIIAFPLTLPSSFFVQHHRLCLSLQLSFSKFANSSTFITLNRRLGMQTRWCKFAKSIIQKSTNWRGTSGTWRGALRSGYWRYTPEWSQPWHFSIVSKLRSGSNLETHHGSQGVGVGRKRAHLGL